jgi:hypothetical protein
MLMTAKKERRFQFRTRATNGIADHPGGTFATWAEAYDELQKREKRAGKMIDGTTEQLRKLTITAYYDEYFLPYVEDNLESLTEQDYTGKFDRDCRALVASVAAFVGDVRHLTREHRDSTRGRAQ